MPKRKPETLDYEIERIALDSLLPYARNARTHSEAQIAEIAGSLKEFGWTNPVLIDQEGTIIAGHGRVRAAQRLRETGVSPGRGWDDAASAPCIRLIGLSDAQRRAYVIADNKLALNAGWDMDMLASELLALRDDGFSLELTGFEGGELEAALNGWSTDFVAKDSAEEVSAHVTIRVTCPAAQAPEVRSAVLDAVNGMEGVEVN
jgi:ParB-like chromosome segregation protein Spo0J